MINNSLFFLAFLLSFSVNAQTSHQVLSASGGDASGSGGSVAYSVGQIVYTTSTGTTGSVAQGVEQAYEISSVGIKETALNISLSIFQIPHVSAYRVGTACCGCIERSKQLASINSSFVGTLG